MKQLAIIFLCLSVMACSGSRPVQLGETRTSLLPCPDKPNCVTSLTSEDDDHYIPALNTGSTTSAMSKLKSIISKTERTKIIVDSNAYLYAEYTSKLMGFVDDVEFLYNQDQGLIHVRSASRLGYRDFDVNRERIEQIRKQLD